MDYLHFEPVVFLAALFLFAIVAVSMLVAPLILGWFLRPHQPNVEKEAIYECGEPTIGSSNVQFDLRFYVVALLFIVFDVEVAFFFPWAVVYGKANTLANEQLTESQRMAASQALLETTTAAPVSEGAAQRLMTIALADLLVFFGVVLVGFAYVWKRGDLDWVRSVAQQRAMEVSTAAAVPAASRTPLREPALTH